MHAPCVAQTVTADPGRWAQISRAMITTVHTTTAGWRSGIGLFKQSQPTRRCTDAQLGSILAIQPYILIILGSLTNLLVYSLLWWRKAPLLLWVAMNLLMIICRSCCFPSITLIAFCENVNGRCSVARSLYLLIKTRVHIVWTRTPKKKYTALSLKLSLRESTDRCYVNRPSLLFCFPGTSKMLLAK